MNMNESTALATAEAQPEDDSGHQWKYLVTEGHMWVARFNRIRTAGGVLVVALSASLLFDVAANTIWAAKIMTTTKSEQPSFLQRLSVMPAVTIENLFRKSGNPTINMAPPIDGVRYVDPSKATPVADLPAYVSGNLAALNDNGKLRDDCAELDDWRSPWLDPKNNSVDVPVCKISGDTIWIGSYVLVSKSDYSPIASIVKPFMGVFHKSNGKWEFKNVAIGAGYSLSGYETIQPQQVAHQFSQDFPYWADGYKGPAPKPTTAKPFSIQQSPPTLSPLPGSGPVATPLPQSGLVPAPLN